MSKMKILSVSFLFLFLLFSIVFADTLFDRPTLRDSSPGIRRDSNRPVATTARTIAATSSRQYILGDNVKASLPNGAGIQRTTTTNAATNSSFTKSTYTGLKGNSITIGNDIDLDTNKRDREVLGTKVKVAVANTGVSVGNEWQKDDSGNIEVTNSLSGRRGSSVGVSGNFDPNAPKGEKMDRTAGDLKIATQSGINAGNEWHLDGQGNVMVTNTLSGPDGGSFEGDITIDTDKDKTTDDEEEKD